MHASSGVIALDAAGIYTIGGVLVEVTVTATRGIVIIATGGAAAVAAEGWGLYEFARATNHILEAAKIAVKYKGLNDSGKLCDYLELQLANA